jgi:adenylate cyclase
VPLVRCLPDDVAVEVPAGTLLTDAIRAAGLPIATACGDELVCGRCGVRILRGAVAREKPVERRAKRRNRVPDALRLACVIRVHGDLEVTADYWGSGS